MTENFFTSVWICLDYDSQAAGPAILAWTRARKIP